MQYILIATLVESGTTVYWAGKGQWTALRSEALGMSRRTADVINGSMFDRRVRDVAVIAK